MEGYIKKKILENSKYNSKNFFRAEYQTNKRLFHSKQINKAY